MMARFNGPEARVNDSIVNLDFNRVCRLCLNLCHEFVDLRPANGTRDGPRQIVEKIKYCYCIKIDITEPLPTKICFPCLQILTLLWATKRNIKASEHMLRNIMHIRNATTGVNGYNRPQIAALAPIIIQPIHLDIPPQHNINIQVNQNPNNDENQNPNVGHGVVPEMRNVENSTVPANNSSDQKLNDLNQASNNNNSGELFQNNEPSCSVNSSPPEKKYSEILKSNKKVKMKKKNKKKAKVENKAVNEIKKEKSNEIHFKKELKIKLEILDLEVAKKLCCQTSKDPSASAEDEGQCCAASNEPKPEKIVKEIGTVIDQNNILSPAVKRIRKSIPKS